MSPIAFPFWRFLLSLFHFEDFCYRRSILKISPTLPFSNLFSLNFTILITKPKVRYCYSVIALWRYLLSPFHFEDFSYRLPIFKISPLAFPFWRCLLLPFHFDDFSYRLFILRISPFAFPFWRFLLLPFHFEDFSYRLCILKISPIAFSSKWKHDRRNLQNEKAIGEIIKMERR
jgi:hypothetical protein